MSAPKVIWEPQPRQAALIACPVFEIFYGGARGGGKTDGVLGDWASHADQYGKDAIGLMVRRERTQLIETIERSKALFGPIGAQFHEQDKLWRFTNGARLRFAYLERDADADAYQGHSYSRIYIEEIGTFPSATPVLKLMATLRSGAGVPVGFRATGNPGGPGHQWVKARYIDPAPLGWRVQTQSFKNPWTGETVTRDRVFIPSKLQDNKFLGNDYVANLQMTGSEQLVRAWLEGDWSVIEGAFFPEFSEGKHVVAPFAIPQSWLRFRAADWGSARPFSIGWWAVASDDFTCGMVPNPHDRGIGASGNSTPIPLRSQRRIIPRGALIQYREWYGATSPNVGLKMPAEDVGSGIVARETTGELEEKIAYSVLDPAAFASDGGPSIAERFASRKVFFHRADNSRVSHRGALGGWDQVRARLIGNGDGQPMIFFLSTCRDIIRTLPALQHDLNRPEDVDTEGEDHAPDSARYACMSRPYIRHIDQRPEDKILSVGPGNQVTLDDMWDNQPKRKRARI